MAWFLKVLSLEAVYIHLKGTSRYIAYFTHLGQELHQQFEYGALHRHSIVNETVKQFYKSLSTGWLAMIIGQSEYMDFHIVRQ